MGEVYKKFGIPGDTRGKEAHLLQTIESIIASRKSESPSPTISTGSEEGHPVWANLEGFVGAMLMDARLK
jgi:hypothetical protein